MILQILEEGKAFELGMLSTLECQTTISLPHLLITERSDELVSNHFEALWSRNEDGRKLLTHFQLATDGI